MYWWKDELFISPMLYLNCLDLFFLSLNDLGSGNFLDKIEDWYNRS